MRLMVVTPSVGHLGGIEQCHPSGKGEGGQRRKRLVDVFHRNPCPDGEKDNSRDERQVQIAVGV